MGALTDVSGNNTIFLENPAPELQVMPYFLIRLKHISPLVWTCKQCTNKHMPYRLMRILYTSTAVYSLQCTILHTPALLGFKLNTVTAFTCLSFTLKEREREREGGEKRKTGREKRNRKRGGR